MTETAKHSVIGASSMYRWSVCPGSVALSKTVPPSQPSAYAMEGTRAHEVAAHYLLKKTWLPDTPIDMMDAVKVYTDAVEADLNEGQAELFIEYGFNLSKLYPGLFGTSDCVIYYPKIKFLRVYDYKHGAGIAVDVEGNQQLRYYALGVMMGLNYEVDECELIIVQPRCPHADGPIRRERLSGSDLFDFALELVNYAKATTIKNAPLVAGGHCRFCPGVGVCSVVHEKSIALAKEEFSPTISYDPQKLSQALEWLPKLEAWIAGVRDFAYAEASHGRMPPGFKLVEKRATRKWKPGIDENVLAMCLGLKPESIVEKSLLSPAQVEKVLPKNAVKELANFTISLSSGTTLVHDSDKRQAVKNDPASEFSVVPTTK